MCHGGYEREGVELLAVLLLSLGVLMTSTESQVRELERNNVSVEHIRKYFLLISTEDNLVIPVILLSEFYFH